MRVVYVTGALRVGGSETQLLNLILNLPREIEPVVVTLREGQRDRLLRENHIEHLVVGTGTTSVLGLPASFCRLLSVLEDLKPDIVQSHLPGTNIISSFACESAQIPHILMEEGLGTARPWWEKRLRRIYYRYPSHFVCNSEAILERMSTGDGIRRDRITLIRNAVVFNNRNGRQTTRALLGIESGEIVILTASSLKPIKGIDYLIKGFHEFIENTGVAAKLLIAGEGTFREEYERQALELGGHDVIFLGNRDDIPDLMMAADIYVSPSLSEGLSNSILEAMFARLPVIATDVGGSSLIVRESESGVLVDPASSEAIAEALKSVVTKMPGNDELEKARDYVKESFSTERVVGEFTELYWRLANA